MLDYWFILPVGLLISALVSSVGIGGGLLWMPFFLIILKFPPEIAVVTSLMIQVVGMGSASIAFVQQQRIDFKLAFIVLLIALPGTALGALVASQLTASYMQFILGVLVLLTAFLFVSAPQKYHDFGQNKVEIKRSHKKLWITIPASIGSGLLSSSMNEWLIPVFRGKLSLGMHYAIATSIFISFVVSFIAALTHLSIGHQANLMVVLWAIPGVIAGAQIGAKFAHNLNEKVLKEVFIFFLTLVGVHLIYNAY
ncbi:sulfite exporter TauE/SafE family protein [Candidatus Venteria ishoeyi]|uniref:Probable membrane transporter protein n=1 Tax=Candidatus Venteria ishoeyi TaxID=1899563 RepID=A0A1H6F6I0_9GAMM|nr:sulfite exporter TauE/SafE family protein [Candidatus Venteria ishoeyi]MDM8547953.1 sulfite exporter TauE/SafE family protein [Candidatus Venteria ishoeyi]SEH05133.1 Uncharacterised protein [Candidatus Venteria ishoeyi]SEH06805.1 Uncharacterised protein [Candidatus Venteria ishoeyi]